MAAAAVVAVQLTFSYAQLESGDFENCTTGCSLSIESLLLNSAIHPDMIDRTYVWATTFSLQSNGTHSASVVAVYANRTPIVCASGEPALCAVAAASLELHCADGREWTVASERNCSFLATCNTFNSSSDLYLIDWGRSSNCAANEPSNFSCASPPNITGCPYCNDAFNECASLALPAAGCKPGATANVSSNSSFLSQTGQIVVIAVGGGSAKGRKRTSGEKSDFVQCNAKQFDFESELAKSALGRLRLPSQRFYIQASSKSRDERHRTSHFKEKMITAEIYLFSACIVDAVGY
ncbi:hypothetical protein EMCRGX_G014507 [Ephydatia muelleri]